MQFDAEPSVPENSRQWSEVEKDIQQIVSGVKLLQAERPQRPEQQESGLPHLRRLAELSRQLRSLAREVQGTNATAENKRKMSEGVAAIQRFIGDMLGFIAEKYSLANEQEE